MTIVHVLNFTIPIGFIVFFGFLLDRMCKPAKPKQKADRE
jgi:hypothetical protein